MTIPDRVPEKIPEVFLAVADLAKARALKPANQYPGCMEIEVDEHWWIALNGHREAMACSKGPVVDSFTMYVEFNGWPAGVVGIDGGVLVGGERANEATLLEALKRATKETP